VRKGDRAGPRCNGTREATIKELFTPQWGDRGPIGDAGLCAQQQTTPTSAGCASGARAQLQRATKLEYRSAWSATWRVVEDPGDELRIKLIFPGKPSPGGDRHPQEKAFRWAPSEAGMAAGN